jgi:hypothetical protein
MSNVEISTATIDRRPAFWLQDVADADFFHLRLPTGTAYALDRVSKFKSFACRSVRDLSFSEVKSPVIVGEDGK